MSSDGEPHAPTGYAQNLPIQHCPMHAKFHFSNMMAERKTTDWSSLTLEQVFEDPIKLFRFQRFCLSMCGEENIMFLNDYSRFVIALYKSAAPEKYTFLSPPPIEKLLGTTPEDDMFAQLPDASFTAGSVLIADYLADRSPMELNISSELRKSVLEFHSRNTKRVYPSLFHEVRLEIQRLLRQNYLKSFTQAMQAEEKLEAKTPEKKAIKICIIGGGFCGVTVAKRLDSMLHKKSASGLPVQLTLFDNKTFFEFTPMIPKCMVRGDTNIRHSVNHQDYLKSPNSSFVLGHVRQVRDGFVQTETNKLHEYDYLVIATGSSYASGIKVKEAVSQDFRSKTLAREHTSLTQVNAKQGRVLIIGGGVVGVEMAGEIMQKFPQIKVTIVASRKRLLHHMPPRAHEEAFSRLVAGGVDIVLGDAIQRYDDKADAYVSVRGIVLKTDLVYWCGGPSPLTNILQTNFPDHISETGEVKVNEFLQLESRPNVFLGGDIVNARNNRLAAPAMAQGRVIAENLIRMIFTPSGLPLQRWVAPPPEIWVSIGLGFGMRVQDGQVKISPKWEAAQRFVASLYYRELVDPNWKHRHWFQLAKFHAPCMYFSLCCCCPCLTPKRLPKNLLKTTATTATTKTKTKDEKQRLS